MSEIISIVVGQSIIYKKTFREAVSFSDQKLYFLIMAHEIPVGCLEQL